MEDISRAFEWIACAVLIAAFSLTVLAVTRDLVRADAASNTYRRGREIFGRGLLISLEVSSPTPSSAPLQWSRRSRAFGFSE